jgi:hypothetical protein
MCQRQLKVGKTPFPTAVHATHQKEQAITQHLTHIMKVMPGVVMSTARSLQHNSEILQLPEGSQGQQPSSRPLTETEVNSAFRKECIDSWGLI